MMLQIFRRSSFFFFVLFAILFASCKTKDGGIEAGKRRAINRLTRSIDVYKGVDKNPRSLDEKGNIILVPSSDWTSGFYPGCLWFAYELSDNSAFITPARHHTEILEKEKDNGTTHDMGFKMYSSYGNGYRLTHEPSYHDILLESARTLISRYNPVVGCIRSWDHHRNVWEYPVIIDNMMNLELLFLAFRETGDSLYYRIAVSHADRTMHNHFREDYSSWHVINYDTLTGKVISRETHQGYSDSSCWSRGEAWGLYGFTMCYRYTKERRYLAQAEHIAAYILRHLPEDMVPYWDYDAPRTPEEPRDASAAAITSSALYELSIYGGDNAAYYREKAEDILRSLSDKYMLPDTATNCFILDHSTGNYPAHSEVDVPIIYADYYFLESLIRRDSVQVPASSYKATP